MRSSRGSSGSELSRADRGDAAARRLALLAADLGATGPGPRSEGRPAPDGDHTEVLPSQGAPLPEPKPDEPPGLQVVPRPGRHAARRRLAMATSRMPGLPGLGAAQLAVVALIAATGVALTAWWVVRGQAAPVATVAAPPPSSATPLVAGTPDADPGPHPSSADPTGTVTVDVTGKVRRPGIVVLDAGARVVDALEAAGGERAGVDLSTLNLARVLVDGEQIVVGVRQPTAPAAPSGSTVTGAPTALVNLNTATQAELEALPEVGPVTALAILAWREEHGGFTSVDELLEVDGIGDATLSQLAPYVTV